MRRVIAIVEDLLFLSRVREAARGSGLEVVTLRRAQDLATVAAGDVALVLVDADGDRLPWRALLDALRAAPALAGVPVIAFVSHAHAERADQARLAGSTRVLARSAFVQELPRLLAAAAGASPLEEKNP